MSNNRYSRRVVDTKSFPRALVVLFVRGVVQGRLPMTRHQAFVIFWLALLVGLAAVVLAPFVWARDWLDEWRSV